MKTRILPLLIFILSVLTGRAQDFPYGAVTLSDLTMKRYDRDTTAGAVVLKEFGEAFISNEDYHLVFKYHVRMKILKKNALDRGNIKVWLRQESNNRIETIDDLKASSFALENGSIREESVSNRDVFTEEENKYWRVKKFAIPNVREGSVIEFTYKINSPFIYNFHKWEFQSDIPKVESEYWASLPGVYIYNITLRGFLKLSKNESEIQKQCLGSGSGPLSGGFSADCALMKLGMKDIPAFVEEEYMTSEKNFLSAIYFELSEVRYPDGRVDKIAKEWKDVDDELRQESKFGVQLRRGKDIAGQIEPLVEHLEDPLVKAKKVFDFIKGWYSWNETYGIYSELGIRKAFDERKGNVADINLSLVAALRFAGLDADPVILSTRSNGTVMELHPVLSEFNYVVAKVNIGDKVYLADATEKVYPFGMLPERCINGKGRVMTEKNSYWIDLKPSDKGKVVSILNLTLDPDGIMRGSLLSTFMGYSAVSKRRDIRSYASQDEYIKQLKSNLGDVEIKGYDIGNLEDIEKPVTRKLDIEIAAFDDPDASNFLFNPFLLEKWDENPFKSSERLYPVDFNVPMERTSVCNLQYPPDFQVENIPPKVGLALPNAGGRFLFDAQNIGNRLSVTNSLVISRTVYSSDEYHYLRELFSRILQLQNGELVFKRIPKTDSGH